MKNKHLVLLFLGVILLGLFVRWLPVQYRSFFRTALIQVDTARLTLISISRPQQPELRLERTETGWVAEQNGRVSTVNPSDLEPLLSTLAELHSIRTIKSKQLDTLGFTGALQLSVRIFQEKKLMERFDLGAEVEDDSQGATYLQLPLHEGVYLVRGQLQQLFGRNLNDFRDKTAVPPDLGAVQRIGLAWEMNDSLLVFEKTDSLQHWVATDKSVSITNDSVQNWLAFFQRLNGSPFADYFDESQASQTRLATMQLERAGNTSLTFQFYYIRPPEVPEDLSILRQEQMRRLPAYVFHSSANPMNYFAVADSNLVRFLCYGLRNNKSGL